MLVDLLVHSFARDSEERSRRDVLEIGRASTCHPTIATAPLANTFARFLASYRSAIDSRTASSPPLACSTHLHIGLLPSRSPGTRERKSAGPSQPRCQRALHLRLVRDDERHQTATSLIDCDI